MWVHVNARYLLWVSVGWQRFVWDQARRMVINRSHLRFISPLQLYSSLMFTAKVGGRTRGAGQVSSFARYRGWTRRNASLTVHLKGTDTDKTRTAQRNVGRDSGTERKQKASPLPMYHGGQVEKKYGVYVPLLVRPCPSTAHSSLPRMGQGGHLRAPKARSRECVFAGECVQTRRSHQRLKDKGNGG